MITLTEKDKQADVIEKLDSCSFISRQQKVEILHMMEKEPHNYALLLNIDIDDPDTVDKIVEGCEYIIDIDRAMYEEEISVKRPRTNDVNLEVCEKCGKRTLYVSASQRKRGDEPEDNYRNCQNPRCNYSKHI